MYNYYEDIKGDVLRELREYLIAWFDAVDCYGLDKNDVITHMEECMWSDDDITGNGSGSYTFDREKAREYLMGNEELLVEAMEAFGELDNKECLIRALTDPEWGDVTIRCYLLSQVLWDNADIIYKEYQDYCREIKGRE